jgi:hypothetical protein
MTRIVSFSSLCAVLAAFSGCAADSGASNERGVSPYVMPPATCAAGDPTCVDPQCDPSVENCDPKVPPCDPNDPSCGKAPCDPSDTNCDPKVPPTDSCAAQQVKADESCGSFLGYAWNGKDCFALSGCACIGPDCDALFKTADACKEKYQSCDQPADFCSDTAKELEKLLAAARACNIASASKVPQCDGSFVQTVAGCPVPVASGSSAETKAYTDLYLKYAANCPLPVPACPSPKGIPIGCVQGPDADSLIGQCSLNPDGSTGGAAAD